MKVSVNKKVYSMTRTQYKDMLKVASEQVNFGIYAIEKGNYAELRCDKCRSITQLKALTRNFKSLGYKVYANK